mmetsp:Transcript_6080/g.9260  ORF Transcript_6080/g.9260 Transcript_6080/m.9260 type:complete len:254 (+) Transcript_6080:163-924(+)|eukprot:CAMPEP_0118678752 /NCGR_PEP_ID=MMETSP0800-20121206/3396_1 /TAXON_ID=210618 ORGANISM="Striatella unipunctata, Strain CCMP2910" /NCGR_SAMPLE_ID=MMETSP0800 /ASSEMBLY_ACC=CAM_ASM_000638 /LENGTH=253 /DNA_ID=CAMNT_0006574649 /DNA_START=86 /DNA_END=847 /DNA_ORIENTATION=+
MNPLIGSNLLDRIGIAREEFNQEFLDLEHQGVLEAALNRDVREHTTKSSSLLNGQRIILFGPPKSGRSSLAMDTAYSICVKSLQSPNELQSCRGCQKNPCHCSIVLFITHKKSSLFPLYCRQHVKSQERCEDSYSSTPFQNKLRELDKENETWHKNILCRIHIVYVKNTNDLIEYLMSVQCLPAHKQPIEAILIDDIGEITLEETQQGSFGSTHEVSPPETPWMQEPLGGLRDISHPRTYNTATLMQLMKISA